jgi:hypothetical protein
MPFLFDLAVLMLAVMSGFIWQVTTQVCDYIIL